VYISGKKKKALTFAAEEEYGSSNIDHIFGFVFCHHESSPE